MSEIYIAYLFHSLGKGGITLHLGEIIITKKRQKQGLMSETCQSYL